MSSKLAVNAWQWTRLTLGRAEPVNDGERRYTRLARGVMTGIAGKGVGMVVSVISIPLTVGYLGAERYGVWVTVSTLLAWLSLADLGLGNGLTNALSEAFVADRRDLARSYVSTAFTGVTAVMVLIGAALFIAWPWLNWAAIFNVQSPLARAEVGPAVAVAVAITLLNFPLSLVTTKIYLAHQEGTLANVWGAAGNVASLFAIVLVTHTQGGLVWLVVALSGSQLLIGLLSTLWLVIMHKPWLLPHPRALSRHAVGKLGHVGLMFFVVQAAGLLIFQTDNLIIAHFAGPDQVTPYSVAYRLFGYTSLLQVLIFPNLWPAYTEAIARHDVGWVRRTFRANAVWGTALTIALAVPLIFVGIPIIRVWAGEAAVPPFPLMGWMAAWSVIYTLMTAVSCLQSAAVHIRNQMFYALSTAIVDIALSIWWIRPFGITGVIAATVIAYLLCNNIPSFLDVAHIFRSLQAADEQQRAESEPAATATGTTETSRAFD